MKLLDRWQGWPEAIRWVLFMPAVLVSTAVCVLLITLIAHTWGQGKFWNMLLEALRTSTGVFVSIAVTHELVPRAKRAFAAVVACLWALLLLLGLASTVFVSVVIKKHIEISEVTAFVACIVGAITVLAVVREFVWSKQHQS